MMDENQIQEGDRNNESPFDSQILNFNILKCRCTRLAYFKKRQLYGTVQAKLKILSSYTQHFPCMYVINYKILKNMQAILSMQ